ncbi:hypothetical protein CB0940_06750 [Cercospora beticola]|uniref:Uncharacterized protein n=1 Tax=Cercospora beticola TaxID=122368 RepID=A0A2G5H8R1_CERBT|nr:hypothetical protein CB0940_06750 [Cercospora beticola]PIA88916.1 hypothetical protein CB0940_06750 [Cercospora beticola]WPB02659.1 hypothetical protein RHO25_007295 [Cercospora beticola]
MDGGTEELLKRKEIKLAVKRSFSALRSCQNRARKIGRTAPERADCPPKTVDNPSLIAETLLYSALNTHPLDSALPGTNGQDSTAVAALSSRWEDRDELQVPFQTREAALLMHYLDDVFQWQFPYCNSSDEHGNRGWLLMLLSRRGPSFYAAISIAALHKAGRDQSRREINATQEALGYRARALKELHKLLTSNNVDHLMQNKDHLAEFFACSILLVGFEVLNGGTEDWRLHVDAITSLASSMELGIVNPRLAADSAGLQFLITAVLWLDLISYLRMEDITGCRDWVMQAIGDIATLRDWKEKQKLTGRLSVLQLATKARPIEESLNVGLDTSEPQKGSTRGTITKLFALAALVWLHAVVSEPLPSLPEIRHAVSQSVTLISESNKLSLSGAVWALCVTASMAEESIQPFFHSVFEDLIRDSGQLGNASTAFSIIEEVWARQRRGDGESLAI